ncbi:YbbR-like domain-containing protein [Bacillaceae bacterium Marseille-Q3522]|nr:YbbR-like domain-containing protein [Bacillaceae bacterium Marseille-Q3522]
MDKWIDKLIQTKWFVRVLALVLAFMLFESVYDSSKGLTEINVPGEQDTEVIEGVPVKSYYDTDSVVVTGVPETVTVTLEGPRIHLQPAKLQRNFEVYVDLTSAELGEQRVPIEIRGLSDQLEATIEPLYANVEIQEKVTKEYPVEAEFNHDLIEDGYVAGDAVAEPGRVKVTGAKDVMDQVAYVKASLNLTEPIDDEVKTSSIVTALDKDLNKLDVTVEPQEVEVTVPVKASTKKVPINVVREGTPPENVTIQSISLNVNEAIIMANQDVLDDTENVRVEVDVSNIRENTEITLPVIISKGIVAVDPKQVQATIRVEAAAEETNAGGGQDQGSGPGSGGEEKAEKTIADVPIQLREVPSQFNAVFLDPANGRTSVTVSGPNNIVNGINASNITLFIDLRSVTNTGVRNASISVTAPPNITWELAMAEARIEITDKD